MNETKYFGKNKISRENAEKVFEKILTKFEIAEIDKEDVTIIINKIMFGKMYFEDDILYYELMKGINRGNGIEKKFVFDSPEQSVFQENDIDLMSVLMAYEKQNTSSIANDSMSKIAITFIGLQPDFAKHLSMKDTISLFTIGLTLFFGG